MPAIDLISVDFPAPLSPTSAITSPSRTSKSTSISACTDPKFFETPRQSSVGVDAPVTGAFLPERGEGRPDRPPLRRLLAVLRVDALADGGLLHEAVLEEQLVVRLRDPDRRQEDRRRAADLAVRRHGLVVEDVDRGLGSSRRLEPDRLVHGSGLPAGDD